MAEPYRHFYTKTDLLIAFSSSRHIEVTVCVGSQTTTVRKEKFVGWQRQQAGTERKMGVGLKSTYQHPYVATYYLPVITSAAFSKKLLSLAPIICSV
jgi:hypothetical protein